MPLFFFVVLFIHGLSHIQVVICTETCTSVALNREKLKCDVSIGSVDPKIKREGESYSYIVVYPGN